VEISITSKKIFSLFFSSFNNLVQHKYVLYSTEVNTSVKCVRYPANTVKYIRSGSLFYTVCRAAFANPVLYCAVMFYCDQVRELQSQFLQRTAYEREVFKLILQLFSINYLKNKIKDVDSES
jgi:hypothetical protein